MDTPLKKIRKKLNLTLKQVADVIALDQSNLSRIERGVQSATPEMAEKLSKYFDGRVSEMQILYPSRFVEQKESNELETATVQ